MNTFSPITLSSLSFLGPELVLLSVGILLIVVDLFCKNRLLLPWLTAAGTLVSLVLLFNTSSATVFGNMYVVDGYSVFFKMVCLIGLLFTVLFSECYLETEKLRHGEYYSLLVFSTVGMMAMVSGGDLIVVYLGLELMALSVYCLVGLLKQDSRSNEASLKYFLMGAFSSGLLLYGISLIYGLTGTTDLSVLSQRVVSLDLMGNHAFLVGLGLVLVAFCFKIAAAPFHMWAPDVYEGAPSSITAFMAVAPKAAAFAVLGRVLIMGFGDVHIHWGPLIAFIAVLTMAIGNIAAIAQKSLKRMLAYSSVAHAGYALLGILAGNNEGLSATMNYLFIYAFMNMGAFAILILLCDNKRRGEQLDDYRGLAKTNPLAAALMLVFLFSLAGIPPTAGFIGKFYLLVAAIHAGYIVTVVAAMVFSVISAYYYLRVVRYMYFENAEQETAVSMSPGMTAALVLAMIGMIGMATFPAPILSLAGKSLIGF
ncbi:MAG: NADH-quinone oxidoreductase subunit N [Desulfobulbaceae bacterium]|nr:NADH-quinone oxidoreductase subunit N [Desulfobulbaceae bacterium]